MSVESTSDSNRLYELPKVSSEDLELLEQKYTEENLLRLRTENPEFYQFLTSGLEALAPRDVKEKAHILKFVIHAIRAVRSADTREKIEGWAELQDFIDPNSEPPPEAPAA